MFARLRNSVELPLINTADPSFELELHRRQASYVDCPDRSPEDLKDFEEAITSTPSDSSASKSSLLSFQRRLRNSCNEAAVVQSIMPKLVPVDVLLDSDHISTIPNQQWDKECSLPIPTTAQYRVPSPKPDLTIGLSTNQFSAFESGLAYLGHRARPIRCLPNLAFPLVTVEAKGDRGQNVCRLQNLHNAAVMLHQSYRLWEDTGATSELYYKSLVCTISITTQTCGISHFWLEPSTTGTATVCGRLFKSWSLNVQDATVLDEIQSSVENAINHTITRGTKLILERLKALEEVLEAIPSPCCTPSCRKRKSWDRYDHDDPEESDMSPPRRRIKSVRGLGSRRSSGRSASWSST